MYTGTLSATDNLYYLDSNYVRLMLIDKESRNTSFTFNKELDEIIYNHISMNPSYVENAIYNVFTYKSNQVDLDIDIDKDLELSSNTKSDSLVDNKNDLINYVHNLYGHLSEYHIKRALRLKLVTIDNIVYDDIKHQHLDFCPYCMQGKMKIVTNTKLSSSVYKLFEKIGGDYKGKFRTVSYHGYNGYFLFCDNYSHYVYVYLCKSKDVYVEAIQSMYDHVKVLMNEISSSTESKEVPIKIFQCDYDSIFIAADMKEWLVDKSIKAQLSAPYSHFQNGQVERDIQSVMNKARVLMFSRNVPSQYWEYAIIYACYLINRSPTTKNTITPYHAIYNQVPDLSNLVPFYAPGVYHLTNDERSDKAWSAKANMCRFLGFDELCKDAYIVLNINNHRVYSRRDCKFELKIPKQTIDEIYDKEMLELDKAVFDEFDIYRNTVRKTKPG
jgi:hypothetical protein